MSARDYDITCSIVIKERMPKGLRAIIDQYPEEWEHFKDGDEISFCSMLYEPLYEYFCNSGEMPYGVMKARTGDPDIWITHRMEKFL
jgi:hypothetical protein